MLQRQLCLQLSNCTCVQLQCTACYKVAGTWRIWRGIWTPSDILREVSQDEKGHSQGLSRRGHTSHHESRLELQLLFTISCCHDGDSSKSLHFVLILKVFWYSGDRDMRRQASSGVRPKRGKRPFCAQTNTNPSRNPLTNQQRPDCYFVPVLSPLSLAHSALAGNKMLDQRRSVVTLREAMLVRRR